MSHQVIYVPGLGDNRKYWQPQILWLWRLFGLKVHFLAMGWADEEKFSSKLERLLDKIDELKNDKNTLSLVGVSAGASAVINAYAARSKDVNKVILICGKVNNPQAVNPMYYQKNPAFKESLFAVGDSLKKISKNERHRIMSIHPLKDFLVPVEDTKIDGAIEKTVPTTGHILSIFYAIIFGVRSIARFINS
ncbi:MAG TPA: alpha/beta hydrolase [Candidatus Saccharimonadales bacterium]|nr:alpha/beta hydrolase [Candidatus Saccharimonadales bacterium]